MLSMQSYFHGVLPHPREWQQTCTTQHNTHTLHIYTQKQRTSLYTREQKENKVWMIKFHITIHNLRNVTYEKYIMYNRRCHIASTTWPHWQRGPVAALDVQVPGWVVKRSTIYAKHTHTHTAC